MATVNQIFKALAGLEDMLFGQGTVTQSRVGVDEIINKINGTHIPYSGDVATADLVSLVAQLDNVEAGAAPRGNLTIPVASGVVNVTVPQWYNASLDITGVLTANVELVVPDNLPQIFVLDNLTTGPFTLTVKHAATPGVTVIQGVRSLLYTTGVVVEAITNATLAVVAQTGVTGSAVIPSGTTAQRDGTPAVGYQRWNTTNGGMEVWDGTNWSSIGGGGYTLTPTKVTNYTAALGEIVPADTTGGVFDITLPALVVGTPMEVKVFDPLKTWGTNNLGVIPNGTDTIEGVNAADSMNLNGGWIWYYAPDGTDWQRVTDFAGASATVAPTFRAHSSANTAATSGVYTKLALNTEDWDSDAAFDSTTNYRFTPTRAGYYQVNALLLTPSNASQSSLSIYKNGADYLHTYNYHPTTGVTSRFTLSDLVYLNGATDYIEMFGMQAGGTILNAGASMSAVWIRS